MKNLFFDRTIAGQARRAAIEAIFIIVIFFLVWLLLPFPRANAATCQTTTSAGTVTFNCDPYSSFVIGAPTATPTTNDLVLFTRPTGGGAGTSYNILWQNFLNLFANFTGGVAGEVTYWTGSTSIGPSSGLVLGPTVILSYNTTRATISSGTTCTVSIGSGCAGFSTGDCGVILIVNVSTTYYVVLPNSITGTCPITVQQKGSGTVELSPASGATLTKPHSFLGYTAGQYSTIGAYVDGNSDGTSAEWNMTGDAK